MPWILVGRVVGPPPWPGSTAPYVSTGQRIGSHYASTRQRVSDSMIRAVALAVRQYPTLVPVRREAWLEARCSAA
eukprot:1051884-Rhodomonas_salina.6